MRTADSHPQSAVRVTLRSARRKRGIVKHTCRWAEFSGDVMHNSAQKLGQKRCKSFAFPRNHHPTRLPP